MDEKDRDDAQPKSTEKPGKNAPEIKEKPAEPEIRNLEQEDRFEATDN